MAAVFEYSHALPQPERRPLSTRVKSPIEYERLHRRLHFHHDSISIPESGYQNRVNPCPRLVQLTLGAQPQRCGARHTTASGVCSTRRDCACSQNSKVRPAFAPRSVDRAPYVELRLSSDR